MRYEVKIFLRFDRRKKIVQYTPSSLSIYAPYQLNSMGHAIFGKNFFTEREHDKNYHLIFTVSGSGIIKCGGKAITLDKNQIIFLNANDYHYYCTGKSDDWEYKWVIIKGPGCSNFARLINQNTVNAVSLADLTEFNYCFDKIVKVIETKDYQSDLKIPVLIMRMLTEIAINRNKAECCRKPMYHKEIIESSIRFIEENFCTGDLSIGDIAGKSGFNVRYFSRLFNKFTGSNPYEYITRMRIDKSKLLLKNTYMPVSEVAAEVGFENINVFIRDFKKFTGTTPLKFRMYV